MSSERTCQWVDRIAHILIHHAAQRAPGPLSERLDEEWLADLAAQRGPMARFLFALGCCWATNSIAREHAVQVIPTSTVLADRARLVRYADEDAAFFTGRKTAFVLVACLNAAVLFGLQMGVGPLTRATGASINLVVKGVASAAPATTQR